MTTGCRAIVGLMFAAAFLPGLMFGQAAGSASGSVCIAPESGTLEPLSPTGVYCKSGKLTLSFDKHEATPWPTKQSVKIGDLAVEVRHRIVIMCDGKPQQSVTFRFSELKTAALCLFLDGAYRTVQLWDAKGCPWCKCNLAAPLSNAQLPIKPVERGTIGSVRATFFRSISPRPCAAEPLKPGTPDEVVTPDLGEAIRAYRKAADNGDADAQVLLGDAYRDGKGVQQNYTEAAAWYRKAAEAGNARGQCSLGLAYYSGHGVTWVYDQAVWWFRKAAKTGHSPSQFNLGLAYIYGQGVPQSYSLAYMWVSISASSGEFGDYSQTAEIRDDIAQKMTPQQVADAQRLAADWKPQK